MEDKNRVSNSNPEAPGILNLGARVSDISNSLQVIVCSF